MELTKREQLAYEKKNIKNNYHLRRWTPIRYVDNTRETGLIQDTHSCILGVLVSVEEKQLKRRKGSYILAKVWERGSQSVISVMLFQNAYLIGQYQRYINKWVFISGKAKYDPMFGWSMLGVERIEPYSSDCFKMIPIYSKIRGISDKTFQKHLSDALSENEVDTMPEWMRQRYQVTDINQALKLVMKPTDSNEVAIGNKRLLADDLYYIASQFALSERHQRKTGTAHITTTDLMDSVWQSFPYELTKGQSETVNAIVDKMKQGKPLHALVQGDVGCGKTITGFLPMLATVENGIQACIVAPTKILAKQHYEKLCDLLKDTNIKIGFFAGSYIKKKELENLAAGRTMIAVGTHSLISDRVEFKNLGLIVIDEEHKFGVEQRQKLTEKSESVDVISMSATPIPRTLARAVYGNDTEIFSITDMPGCRKKIVTQYDSGIRRQACVNYILNQGQQVYVVCPAIDLEDVDDDEKDKIMSVSKAKDLYTQLFPNATIATLDGKMRASETEEVLEKFRSGETQILIATTVVEVGVDVPNATLILIENAERFGLAQMHQLRGRVGRGALQSYCLLISENAENDRIKTMCQVSDGFTIAKIDMEQLRKSGNLFGSEQSGYSKYVEEMVANPELYKMILEDARTLSDEILEAHIDKTLMTEFPRRKIS